MLKVEITQTHSLTESVLWLLCANTNLLAEGFDLGWRWIAVLFHDEEYNASNNCDTHNRTDHSADNDSCVVRV